MELGLEMAGYQVDVADDGDTHLVKPVSPNRAHQTLLQLLAHGHSVRDADP